MAPTFDAARLYSIVKRYASFGHHHTGSAADRQTTSWLIGVLESIGAKATTESWAFDRWTGDATLMIGEQTVPSLPIFYSGVEFSSDETTALHLEHAPYTITGSAQRVSARLSRAVVASDDSAIVFAVESPNGLPVQCNRVPSDAVGAPAVVIADAAAEEVAAAIAGGRARLHFSMTCEPASSANVVADLGPADGLPVTITTPLTGWTTAAGERGTGLAVALAMATDLSADHRVTFVGCSGHELDHLGLRHHLDGLNASSAIPDNAIHLGASVAAVSWSDGKASLAPRTVFAMVADERRARLGEIVACANWTLTDPGPSWPGEGGTWKEAGSSVLSFVGTFDHFHTVNDVPERATTPAALARANETATKAARIFLETANEN